MKSRDEIKDELNQATIDHLNAQTKLLNAQAARTDAETEELTIKNEKARAENK